MRYVILLNLIALVASAQPLSQADISARLLAEFRQQVPTEVTISLSKLYVDKQVDSAAKLQGFEPRVPLGLVRFEFATETKHGIEIVRGHVTVTATSMVAVAKERISSGSLFSEENVTFERRRVRRIQAERYYYQLEALADLQAKSTVRKGDVIAPSQTMKPYMVHRGEMVDLVTESRGLSVVARVKSLQRGRLHDWIKVQNPRTKRMVRVRIQDRAKVGFH